MDQIQSLVAQGRLADAIKQLLEQVPTHSKNEVISIQSSFNQLERNIRMGIISQENIRIERARITSSVLDLNQLKDDIPTRDVLGFEENSTPPPYTSPKFTSPANVSELESTAAENSITKILFIAANPNNQANLETDKEHRLLKDRLRAGRGRDRFEFLPSQFATTLQELLRAVNDKPNIVHFSGHGAQQGIFVTTEDNKSQLVPLAALQRLFKNLRGITQIIVLNACYSAEQARVLSEMGIYVIGHNLPVSDPAAISFTEGFYTGLGEEKSVEDAFNDAMFMVLTIKGSEASIVEAWKDGQKLDW